MGELSEFVYLKLSIQGALLERVTANMFAVTAGIEKKLIKVRFYFDGEVTEDDVEQGEVVCSEIIADYPEGVHIESEALSVSKGLEMLQFWAFVRSTT